MEAARAVHAARSVAGAGDAEATVAMPPGEAAAAEGAAGDDAGGAPSETSERLSEGVQDLREKAEALIAGLDKLEERSGGMRADLEVGRARAGPGGQREEERPAWRRWLGGG